MLPFVVRHTLDSPACGSKRPATIGSCAGGGIPAFSRAAVLVSAAAHSTRATLHPPWVVCNSQSAAEVATRDRPSACTSVYSCCDRREPSGSGKRVSRHSQLRRFPGNTSTAPASRPRSIPRPGLMPANTRAAACCSTRWRSSPGAIRGIGRAAAVLCAREGAEIAIVYLKQEQEDAERTAEAVAQEGRRILLIPGDVTALLVLQTRRGKDHRALRAPGHPGQQCGLSEASRLDRANRRSAIEADVRDEHLRVIFHGACCARPHAGRRLDHQRRLDHAGSRAARTCSITPQPRALSMRSRNRWPRTWSNAGFASMRSRRVRCGRR